MRHLVVCGTCRGVMHKVGTKCGSANIMAMAKPWHRQASQNLSEGVEAWRMLRAGLRSLARELGALPPEA